MVVSMIRKDYPIMISATANDGYRFVGWQEGNDGMVMEGTDGTALELQIPDHGLHLKAVFAEE